MSRSHFTALQERVLITLAGVAPRWTLTGGGALVGIYFGHRATRDLDLFWHGIDRLQRLPEQVARLLEGAGLQITHIQSEPAFHQLIAASDDDRVVIDLVADPAPTIEAPIDTRCGSAQILVDSPKEILANKLCALLGRSELRDLVDVRALLDHGLDLGDGVRDAAAKDGGFSPLTLAWVVKRMPVARLAVTANIEAEQAAQLEQFRDLLADLLTRLATPA